MGGKKVSNMARTLNKKSIEERIRANTSVMTETKEIIRVSVTDKRETAYSSAESRAALSNYLKAKAAIKCDRIKLTLLKEGKINAS